MNDPRYAEAIAALADYHRACATYASMCNDAPCTCDAHKRYRRTDAAREDYFDGCIARFGRDIAYDLWTQARAIAPLEV